MPAGIFRSEGDHCRRANGPFHGKETLDQSPTDTRIEARVAKAAAALTRTRQKRQRAPAGAQADKAVDQDNESDTIRRIVAMLQSDRAHLALQPIVSATGTGRGFCECLIRLEDTDGVVQPVGETVVLAERLGLSRTLDRLSLALTMNLLEQASELCLSVNVSALTCSDPEWLTALDGWLAEKPQLARRLIIEITETAMMPPLAQSQAFVAALNARGCKVALDDFGAGYSSFDSLVNLGVDIVKLDGSFAQDILNEPSDREFVAAMVDLAHELEIETVAEWVSDAAAFKLLVDAKLDFLQGYHIGRPQSLEQVLTERVITAAPDWKYQ